MNKVDLDAEDWLKIAAEFRRDSIEVPVWFTVNGDSMYPFIRRDLDQVRLTPTGKLAELKVGDIVLFRQRRVESDYCLHRLSRIDGDRVQTFGDGNLRPDKWMSRDRIVGKAVEIRRGGVTLKCSSPMWRMLFSLWVLLAPVRAVLLLPHRVGRRIRRLRAREAGA